MKIDHQDGGGDGTVPVSSSTSLIHANAGVQVNNRSACNFDGKSVTAQIEDVEHSAFFGDADAVTFTEAALRQLDLKYRKLKIGF